MKARPSNVSRWIAEANRVAKEQCTYPQHVSNAWQNLRKVTRKDKDYTKAVRATARLERCRLKNERDLIRTVTAFMRTQRADYVRKFGRGLRDKGIRATVSAYGAGKTTLKVRYVLFTEADAEDLFDNTQATWLKLGFKKAILSDGYYSWTWTLKPMSEAEAFRDGQRETDMHRPLKLGRKD